MQNETLKDKLTGILEGVVGEDKKPQITGGIVTESTVKWARIDGYNQALHDIRSRIPEAVDGILEAVREEVDRKLVIDVNPSRDDQRDWYRGLGREEAQREMRDKILSIFSLAGDGADGEGK